MIRFLRPALLLLAPIVSVWAQGSAPTLTTSTKSSLPPNTVGFTRPATPVKYVKPAEWAAAHAAFCNSTPLSPYCAAGTPKTFAELQAAQAKSAATSGAISTSGATSMMSIGKPNIPFNVNSVSSPTCWVYPFDFVTDPVSAPFQTCDASVWSIYVPPEDLFAVTTFYAQAPANVTVYWPAPIGASTYTITLGDNLQEETNCQVPIEQTWSSYIGVAVDSENGTVTEGIFLTGVTSAEDGVDLIELMTAEAFVTYNTTQINYNPSSGMAGCGPGQPSPGPVVPITPGGPVLR